MDAVVEESARGVMALPKDGLIAFMQSIIFNEQETKEPFYVLDLGVVEALFDKWTHSLPMVQPFYAVKSNPNTTFLRTLAALGSSFDCASCSEIESILSLGVTPDRIIYANPCKAESHIKYAASVGVNLTTFDSREELEKIRKWHPQCALLIRIKTPEDGGAIRPLGRKFGALSEEVVSLLQAAQAARLTVTGVSFHIGSGATQSQAYESAIAMAKMVFQTAAQLGMPQMHVLNIGGGFMTGTLFDNAASTVKAAIKTYFSDAPELTIVAEPGHFFSETAFTLAVNIIGKRVRGERREYWINDGIYGSMNFLIYGNAKLSCPIPLACTSNQANLMCKGEETYNSTIFGPTCDSQDIILKDHQLPELQVNDWLVFPQHGCLCSSCWVQFQWVQHFSHDDLPCLLESNK